MTLKDNDTLDNTKKNIPIKSPNISADEELEWLNPEDTEKFSRAIQAIKDGFTMKDIRKKYKVSKKVEEQLLNK